MGTSQKRPPGSFDIPDLELDAPPVRPAVAAASRAKGLEFHDPHEEDFELETAQTSLGFGVDSQALPQSAERSRSTSAATPWPSGATPSSGELRLEAEEIARIADYGDASVSWLLAPAYTLRVFTRRRALRRARIETLATLAACESRRDATLAELVRKLRPELESRAQFRAGLAELCAAEQAAGEQERVLASASADAHARLEQIDAQSAALHSEIDTQQGLEQARQRQFDDCSANLKRAEARAKRAQIEIRALQDVAVKRATAAGKPASGQIELTVEEGERLRGLEQQAKALADEVALVRTPYAAAEQELAGVRRRIGELEQQLRGSEQRKTAFTRQARQELSSKGQNASRASSTLSHAYAELGRAVLSGRGAVKVDDAILERLRQHDKEVLRAATNDALQLSALAAYDREKAKQGLLLVAGAIALLVVLFLYALAAS